MSPKNTLAAPFETDTVRNTVDSAVETANRLSVAKTSQPSTLMALVPSLVYAGMFVAPWWSRSRDMDLRKFWKKSDHLAGAIYTFTAKMTAVPGKVVPIDPSIREHVVEAEYMTEVIYSASDFGDGWVPTYGKFIEDVITQDNGGFMEVVGEGDENGPIIGRPITITNLDSSRCQRTGDRTYPVVFYDDNGKPHKLHRSRVMFYSQMASPIREMRGVGFCGVSRMINVAQNLVDIGVYKQEKLGSRPHRVVLLTRGGLDPGDVALAFQRAEDNMDSQGLTRYSKIVMTGSSTIMDADLKEIELSSVPDGFNEYDSTILDMATIALALGIDARELFPGMTGGASRADAIIQHIKQRGKGPGQLLEVTEQLINQKFLPPHLKFVFDFQDDAQDRQVAEIKKIRMERWNYGIQNGSVNLRVVREQMVANGDLDRSQFERLELEDGRLPDGTDMTILFYSDDKNFRQFLDMGVEDPLDTENNEPVSMLSKIANNQREASKALANTTDIARRWYAQLAIYALEALKRRYEEILAPEVQPTSGRMDDTRMADKYQTTRTENLTEVDETEEIPSDGGNQLKPVQGEETI